MRKRSSSTATTSAPVPASGAVSEPSPAPISSTWSPGPTAAISTMRRASAGSIRKCWPRALRGLIPWRAARARIRVGVRAPPGLPGDLDVRDALGERRDLGEGGVAEVDDPPRDAVGADRKSTRLNSSHVAISYAVFCLKKKIAPAVTKQDDHRLQAL